MRKKILTGAAAALLLLGACGGSSDDTTESTGSASTATGTESSAPSEDGAGSSGSEDSGSATEVTLQTFRFEPGEIEIDAGTTVTWTNNDDILHTVTSGIGQKQGVPGVSKNKDAKPDGMFDQEMDGVGATFEFTFEEAGTFEYFCAIHPGMTGTVIVK